MRARARGREAVARALLPGPYTLVAPEPGAALPLATGGARSDRRARARAAAGARDVLDAVGAVAATSANLHGGPDRARLEDVPAEIRAGVRGVVDGGELPGTPSTVIDFTGAEPRVLREGAVPAADALARVAASRTSR